MFELELAQSRVSISLSRNAALKTKAKPKLRVTKTKTLTKKVVQKSGPTKTGQRRYSEKAGRKAQKTKAIRLS